MDPRLPDSTCRPEKGCEEWTRLYLLRIHVVGEMEDKTPRKLQAYGAQPRGATQPHLADKQVETAPRLPPRPLWCKSMRFPSAQLGGLGLPGL